MGADAAQQQSEPTLSVDSDDVDRSRDARHAACERAQDARRGQRSEQLDRRAHVGRREDERALVAACRRDRNRAIDLVFE